MRIPPPQKIPCESRVLRDPFAPVVNGALVSLWRAPGPLRGLAAAFYRNAVVPGALDLADAEALVRTISGLDAVVARAPGLPILAIEGTRERAQEETPEGASA